MVDLIEFQVVKTI